MKIKRGNYDGASKRAYFDTPITAMTNAEKESLLQFILQRADPGMPHAETVRQELEAAEILAREQGVAI